MPALLILLPLGLLALEIYVIVLVAQLIGWWTLLLVVASAMLGFRLLRVRGARALRELRVAIDAGRPPGRELLDGTLSVVGAGLLIPPGFVTSAIGLLMLLPVTQVLARRLLLVAVMRRWRVLRMGTVIVSPGRRGAERSRRGTRTGPPPRTESGRAGEVSGDVVEGEVVQEREEPDQD